MRQATNSVHTQATELYEMARKLEDLTKETTISYAALKVRVEARAVFEQAEDLHLALDERARR